MYTVYNSCEGNRQQTESIHQNEQGDTNRTEMGRRYIPRPCIEKDEPQNRECSTGEKNSDTNLKPKHKTLLIGALALPVLEYSFWMIYWTLEEVRQMYTKTRKQLNIHRMQYHRANVARLYVSRARVGKCLRQINRTYSSVVFSIGQYIQYKADSDYVIHAV